MGMLIILFAVPFWYHKLVKQRKKLQTQMLSKLTAIHITAGDRDRTFPILVSLDGKELGGLTFYFEPTSEPSCGYTSKVHITTLRV